MNVRSVSLVVVSLAVLFSTACGSTSATSPSASPAPTQTRIIGLSGNLAFGAVAVGSRPTATLTISNSGNAPLTVTGLTGPGGYTASWTSGTVPGGGTQLVTIGFAPTAATTYNGTLIVNGDQTSGTNSMSVSGTGVVPIRANIQLAPSTQRSSCVTGLCTSLTFPCLNAGPVCDNSSGGLTGHTAVTATECSWALTSRWGLPGGNLSTFVFRVGTSGTLQSLSGFNDVRSAHTAFRASITWTDIACP